MKENERKGCRAEFHLQTANHTFHSQQPFLMLNRLAMAPTTGSKDNMKSLCQEMLIEQGYSSVPRPVGDPEVLESEV